MRRRKMELIKQPINIILKAKTFAFKKHEGQSCDEGSPYIFHPFQVAQIVSLITSNKNVVAAAYLHDTVEDTNTTYEELVKEFNKEVADLVMEMTHEGKKDEIGFYFPRLKTRDGILIKFADRISNLSRMGSWDDDRKAQYLRKSKFWKSGDEK